jgi:NitT/TauT family transport system substrate-binding protein
MLAKTAFSRISLEKEKHMHRRRMTRSAFALLATMMVGHAAEAAEKVIYLLPAPVFFPAFGPWTVAKQRGYYAAAGIDVDFEQAKGGADVAKQVGAGNALVGGALGDTPIIVRGNGVPVKSIALLGGGGMMELAVLADSPIKAPVDLKGKTIAVMAYQDTTYYALLGVLATVGLTKNDVNAQAVGPTNIWKLMLAKQADAGALVPDWIVDLQSAGATLRVMPATDYFPSMAQAIVASDQVIKEKPELLRKLVAATLHGMKDIVADPEGAAHDFAKVNPESAGQDAKIAEVFKLYVKYNSGGQSVPGEMDAKRLAKLQDFYLQQGIIEHASPVDDLYTNDLIR